MAQQGFLLAILDELDVSDLLDNVLFASFPQKRNGIVFSLGVNYLHSD